MARPTKFTPAVREKIVDLVERGNFPEIAARAAGVSSTTYYKWMKKGEDGPGTHQEFRDAIKAAQAQAEARCVQAVWSAFPSSWQAAAWWLERRDPSRYGLIRRQEIKADLKVGLRERAIARQAIEASPEILDSLFGEEEDEGQG